MQRFGISESDLPPGREAPALPFSTRALALDNVDDPIRLRIDDDDVILDDDVPVPTKSWNDADDLLWHCSILDTGAGQRHANAHAVHVQLRAGHLRAARNEGRAGLRDPSPLFVADVDVCRRRGRGRRGRASAAGAGGAGRALTGALLVATSGALPRTLLVATTALTRALLTTLLVLAAARAARALTGALLVGTSGALPRTLLVATTARTRALLTTLALPTCPTRAGSTLRTFSSAPTT